MCVADWSVKLQDTHIDAKSDAQKSEGGTTSSRFGCKSEAQKCIRRGVGPVLAGQGAKSDAEKCVGWGPGAFSAGLVAKSDAVGWDHFQHVRVPELTRKNVFTKERYHFKQVWLQTVMRNNAVPGGQDNFKHSRDQKVTRQNVFAGGQNHF